MRTGGIMKRNYEESQILKETDSKREGEREKGEREGNDFLDLRTQ